MAEQQERYYVVSESELKDLSLSAWDDATNFYNPGESRPDAKYLREQAEAACRTRPVKTLGGITWWPADYTFD